MGVPTTTGIPQESRIGGRAAEFNLIPQEAALLHDIDLHFVNLGNEGEFSRSGHYRSSEDSVDRLIADGLKPTIRKWGGTRKLLLYAHGGLSSEVTAAVGISRLLPHFMENGIYPMFFMWETGLVDSVRGIIEDAFRRRPFLGWRDDLKDRFLDMLDESIELAARSFGLPIWNQMKGNARGASVADAEPERGATYLAGRLVEYASEEGPLEIHLLGHSAGAIFHAHLLRRLTDLRMKVKTMTLLAPACTVELFNTHIWPHVANNDLQRLTVFNLNDEFERDDSAGPVYNKSLLYLVSESFEPRPGTPILGMNKFVTGDRKLKEKLGQPISGGSSTVIYSVGGPRLRLRSGSTKHSSFDADRATLNSALSIILGKRPKKPF